MRSKITLLLAAAVILLSLAGCSSPGSKLTQEQRAEDFEYMWAIMEQNYPFFEVNRRLTGTDWLANKEKYKKRVIAAGTDLEFLRNIDDVLRELHNKHTILYGSGTYDYYLDSLYTSPIAQDPWSKLLYQPEVLKRYGRSPSAEPHKPAKPTGAGNKSALNSATDSRAQENVLQRIIEAGQTAYLAIHSFSSEHLSQDIPVISKFLAEVQDYKTLILDIRGNLGGNSAYWQDVLVPLLITEPVRYDTYTLYRGGSYAQPFLEARGLATGMRPIAELAEEHLPLLPPESLTMFETYQKLSMQINPRGRGFQGKLYLLVDHEVFSASEGLAALAKSTGIATLAGERTGGDGLGIDPVIAVMPNSKAVFSFSLEMGLMPDGSCNEEMKTVPDIEVDPDRSRPLLEQPAILKILELERN
ncbi:hypothetical protein R70723_30680 [Paenibacillus sp. FSL R7-0273]|uniref:S41 family peptidase n=1 Tax=Paenibacillus sp. FSL R7-0273 TaxID=1536772 RepID=UPI0004F5A64F|nr:S41 family peptidase [Paenibacillus sp. FSL R7-0273]AIQ49768.1 hypothetical protein R70723_30680 [Paenibacillus sp. FSL R7-0273]OMF92349.1 hypothetical protein BK144_13475 [Paenibacillus sp. FSL R7-0273]